MSNPGLGCRHILAVWGFLAFVVIYMLRINLSVALVAMVNTSSSTMDNHSLPPECDNGGNHDNTTEKDVTGEFYWSEYQQGIILGSFFWGYLVTQIPGSYLALHYSAKWVFALGTLCTAVLTLLTPLAARTSIYLLITLRILEGLGEAVTFPAMHTLLGRWSPPYERSKLATIIYSGCQMGTIIGMPLSGFLCETEFLGGWPSVFYIFGGLGIIWFFGWCFIAYDSPAAHPRISAEERDYIITSIGLDMKIKEDLSVPWGKIIISPAFLALCVANFCNNWAFYSMLTSLPTYMSKVLNFNIKTVTIISLEMSEITQILEELDETVVLHHTSFDENEVNNICMDMAENGLLSALPYIVNWITCAVGGQIADTLRSHHVLSTTCVRKMFTAMGLAFNAAGLLAVGFVGCDYVLAIIFFCIGVGSLGLCNSGFLVNHLDLAPQYAGSLLAATNSLGTIPGILGPYVIGIITQSGETRDNWLTVFYISAGITCSGLLIFACFGSGNLQSWAHIGKWSEEEVSIQSEDEPLILPTSGGVTSVQVINSDNLY